MNINLLHLEFFWNHHFDFFLQLFYSKLDENVFKNPVHFIMHLYKQQTANEGLTASWPDKLGNLWLNFHHQPVGGIHHWYNRGFWQIKSSENVFNVQQNNTFFC